MALPTLFSPTKSIIDAVLARLSDNAEGYNALLRVATNAYGLEDPAAIDFAGHRNFYLTQLSTDELLAAGRNIFPTMTLYVVSAIPSNEVKRRVFYGRVTFGIDIFLSDGTSQPPTEFDLFKAAVFDTLMSLFGDHKNRSWQGPSTVNANEYSLNADTIRTGGTSWLQVIRFRMALLTETMN